MTNRIRELRNQKCITMKQLGASLGLAESTISQYETGRREPDIKTLKKLADYFDVTVDYLLGKEKTPTVSGEHDILSEVDIAFYNGFKELTEEQQETIRDMVRLMRERRKNEKPPQD